MKHKKIFLSLFSLFIIFGVVFFVWFFWYRDPRATSTTGDPENNENVSPVNTSVTQLFTLFPGQVIQSDDLDLRIIVNTLYYVPCNSNESSGCRFAQFRGDLTVSLLSNPAHTERVSFLTFPSQTQALGKVFEVLDATSERMNVIVRATR